jgi:vacuolar-type H+-ATPase subunit H
MDIKYVVYNMSMSDTIDDATKKVKNAEQDARAKAETTEDHAEGKPSSETLNKAKEKIKDALD